MFSFSLRSLYLESYVAHTGGSIDFNRCVFFSSSSFFAVKIYNIAESRWPELKDSSVHDLIITDWNEIFQLIMLLDEEEEKIIIMEMKRRNRNLR